MDFYRMLKKRRDPILKKWFGLIADTYPPDTSHFLKKIKDPFSNPVGGTLEDGLGEIFDQLTGSMDRNTIQKSLDPILRIRAIQSFTASRATGFIFFLKKIIHEELKGQDCDPECANQVRMFENRIDDLALIGFDLYMACREKIYELKANEVRNRTFSAFSRAGLLRDLSGPDPGLLYDDEEKMGTKIPE